MSAGGWIALLTTGCFCVLASYANGAFPAPQARTFTEKQVIAARKAVEPVVLWRLDPKAELKRRQAEALAMVYGITEENADSYKRWW